MKRDSNPQPHDNTAAPLPTELPGAPLKSGLFTITFLLIGGQVPEVDEAKIAEANLQAWMPCHYHAPTAHVQNKSRIKSRLESLCPVDFRKSPKK